MEFAVLGAFWYTMSVWHDRCVTVGVRHGVCSFRRVLVYYVHMARPLRIEGNDFWYHVMVRGDDGRTLFAARDEYQWFLTRLDKYCELFRVELHAYALMANHVHLFLRTRQANLGRFMQRLLTGYSVWYNRRRERTGHVFQGRYKAIVVDRNAYGAEVARYIHLNAARAQAAGKGIDEMRRAARTYEWSSYRAYLGLKADIAFLHTAEMLERFGKTDAEQRRNYAVFVEEGLLKDGPDFEDRIRAQSVLGTDRFVERLRRVLVKSGTRDKTAERNRRRLNGCTLEQVVAAVARTYGVDGGTLRRQRWLRSEARRVLLWAAQRWCGSEMSLRAIGEALGGIGISGVRFAGKEIDRQSKRQRQLRKKLADINCKLHA